VPPFASTTQVGLIQVLDPAMRLFLLLILTCLSTVSFACRVRDVPAVEQIAGADAVYLGVVTGITLTDLEQSVLASRKPVISVGGSAVGRIAVVATLRGPARSVIEANLASCGPYIPELQQVVVVLRRASVYTVSADPELVRVVQAKLGGV
jgi:hypothetical protein